MTNYAPSRDKNSGSTTANSTASQLLTGQSSAFKGEWTDHQSYLQQRLQALAEVQDALCRLATVEVTTNDGVEKDDLPTDHLQVPPSAQGGEAWLAALRDGVSDETFLYLGLCVNFRDEFAAVRSELQRSQQQGGAK